MDKQAPTNITAVAVYLPEQWPQLLATAQDADQLEATWEEWYKILQEAKQNLARHGIICIDVYVDVDALLKYCWENNLPNNGSTRAEFAAHVLQEQRKHIVAWGKKRKKKRRK
ncbi:MAG: hypothetical protein E6I32_16750 [Chloroflexi bacterium]|nr:MAG: hypothetical protein E6I32_16750 [Chloroflexota bacterium]